MRIDIRNLRSALRSKRSSGERLADLRVTTGASAFVRKNFDSIWSLRNEGWTWREIAETLAEHGLTEDGGRRAISTNRLTSLVVKEKRRVRVAAGRKARLGRADLVTPATPIGKPAPQGSSTVIAEGKPTGVPSEADLVRAAFDRSRHLLKS